MARLIKETPRLNVQFIDSKTNEILMQVNNRDYSDVGDMFSDTYVSQLLTQKFGDNVPNEVIVLVSANYNKVG